MDAATAHTSPPTPAPAPAPAGVKVYRNALADTRAGIILVALCLWLTAHIVVGVIVDTRVRALNALGRAYPSPPDADVWFSPGELQIGVRAFQWLGSSFLESIAWQVGACALFFAALVVTLTSRLRIFATLFPPILFTAAAVAQCIAYSIARPYWAQGNPIFTLLFMLACWVVTWRLAPRNSGLRELRVLAKDLARQALTSPGSLLFGPIFAKEVRVLGRRRSTYWVRALYPLGLLVLVSVVYFASTSDINRFSAGADRIQRLQEIAPTLALFIAWAQYLLLLFIAASITSSAICDERRTRSLASLMTTPMNATQIVMGKLSSRLVQLLIIGLISVPFLLGVRVFGGLDAEIIIAFVSITITSTLLMASLGILASIWSRKPASAAALAMVLFLLLTAIPLIVVLLAAATGGAAPPMEVLAFSSPVAMAITTFHVTGGGPPIGLRELWTANSLINTVLAIGASSLAAISLRSVMLSETGLEPIARKPRRKERRNAAPPTGTPDSPPDAAPTPGADPVEVIVERDTVVPDNPVLWRECRQPALGSRRMLIIAACIIGSLIFWLYTERSPRHEEPHYIVVIIGMLLFTLQAALVSTPSIANERDGSTWPTLLTTPLTGRQILFPKLIGSLKRLWFIAAIVGAELVIGVIYGRVHPVLFLHLGMIATGVAVLLGGAGLFFSLISRRGSSAALFNMLLAGCLWVGMIIGAIMISELVLRRFSGRYEEFIDVAFLINPVALSVLTLEPSLNESDWTLWQTTLPSGSTLDLFEYTGILAGVSGVGCLIGIGAVLFGATRFNRFSGRTS